MKKLIKTIGKSIFKIFGCLLMLLVMFYMHFYEFNPIYKPRKL